MSRPKILGRILFSHTQARDVSNGSTIDIPAVQFHANVKVPGQIGDLVWVQEPWRAVVPKKPGFSYGIIVGPIGRARSPRLSPRVCLQESVLQQEPAKYLRRKDSCLTLEVMGFSTEGQYRCLAHFENIDAFVKARTADV